MFAQDKKDKKDKKDREVRHSKTADEKELGKDNKGRVS